MAYACPVCATPQADGRHLANHLAFTAMIHGDDHEAWLDEHAPEWEEAGEEALAKRVVGHAAETELSEAIDDPTAGSGRTDEETGEGGSQGHHRHYHHTEDEHARKGKERTDRPPTSGGEPRRDEERTAIEFGARNGETGDDGDERDVAAVLADARELTERMRNGADTAGESERSERDPSGAESRDADGDSDESEGER
jgi:hypothetical protein